MIYKIISIIVFLFGVLLSQELAKTTKGKLVILYNDGTWSYVENSNNSKIKKILIKICIKYSCCIQVNRI